MANAHKIFDKRRTQDVKIHEKLDFTGLLLSKNVQDGLKRSGFERPSPIQLKAIPLGRCGLDLIVQAKSGTGKTCVFTIIALENLILDNLSTQVLVLAPTREIAMQVQDVISTIGQCMSKLTCHAFIGGLPVKKDIANLKNCQIAVGTPGRIKQLIDTKALVTDSIRILILDEADKLLEDSFQEQVNWIYSMLPDNKQMLALSATYPEYLARHLTAYMRNPTYVRLNSHNLALLGIKQYYKVVPNHPLANKAFDAKVQDFLHLISTVSFSQCLLFSNYQLRAQSLCDLLNGKGWPAACISGNLDQDMRLHAMSQLKNFQCRILISTDLTARGIDAENVNLVVNLDIPFDHETYLHRIGRAGRFGTYGVAITYINKGEEDKLQELQDNCSTTIISLPDPTPEDLAVNEMYMDFDDALITTEQIITVDPNQDFIHATEVKIGENKLLWHVETDQASNGKLDKYRIKSKQTVSSIQQEPMAIKEQMSPDSNTVSVTDTSVGHKTDCSKFEMPGESTNRKESCTFFDIQNDFLQFVKKYHTQEIESFHFEKDGMGMEMEKEGHNEQRTPEMLSSKLEGEAVKMKDPATFTSNRYVYNDTGVEIDEEMIGKVSKLLGEMDLKMRALYFVDRTQTSKIGSQMQNENVDLAEENVGVVGIKKKSNQENSVHKQVIETGRLKASTEVVTGIHYKDNTCKSSSSVVESDSGVYLMDPSLVWVAVDAKVGQSEETSDEDDDYGYNCDGKKDNSSIFVRKLANETNILHDEYSSTEDDESYDDYSYDNNATKYDSEKEYGHGPNLSCCTHKYASKHCTSQNSHYSAYHTHTQQHHSIPLCSYQQPQYQHHHPMASCYSTQWHPWNAHLYKAYQAQSMYYEMMKTKHKAN